MITFRGWQKVSYIEYPGKIATVLFTGGCNFRCPYCHNPELVETPDQLPPIEEKSILDFLQERKGLIDALCITGGEPLLWGSSLLHFLEKVKTLGFLVKVDTNGSLYQEYRSFSRSGLVDHFGIDFKLPFSQYALVGNPEGGIACQKTLDEAMVSSPSLEIRTTIFPPFHQRKTLESMGQVVKKPNLWYWQNFKNSKTLDKKAQKISPYPPSLLQKWQQEINQKFGGQLVSIRSS
ncbi:MAG: pyruvate formate lyase activating enzyme [Candidatus Atribacteria bacterium]|nr:pyruvate formate lyase activating enzyme [Candidatus Atribacteria bacterium]